MWSGIGRLSVMTAVALGVSMLLWWLVIGHPSRPVATPSEAPMSPRTAASAYQPIPIQTDVYAVPPGSVYRIPGVIGPATPSLVSQPEPTHPSHYAGGGSSRLAILVTDVQSNWLRLAHGLKSFGVPFTVTTDPYEALRHRVIMVYPVLSGRVLPPTALKAVVAHPRKGGTLIASTIMVRAWRRYSDSRKFAMAAATTNYGWPLMHHCSKNLLIPPSRFFHSATTRSACFRLPPGHIAKQKSRRWLGMRTAARPLLDDPTKSVMPMPSAWISAIFC